MKAIRVISLDFDGCIYNEHFLNQEDIINPKEENHEFKKDNKLSQEQTDKLKTQVIETNQKFLDDLVADISAKGKYQKVILMIGSNRQSRSMELSNGKLSAFIALTHIRNYLLNKIGYSKKNKDKAPIIVDKYLLADSVEERKEGESFKMAKKAANPSPRKPLAENYQHADIVTDESKINILYAQMHHAASKNPKCKIFFDFYDDRDVKIRGSEVKDDILIWLADFYKRNPDLIPANVVLRLHHYKGAAVTLRETIIGQGKINKQYAKSIRWLAEEATNKTRQDSLEPNYYFKVDEANPWLEGFKKYNEPFLSKTKVVITPADVENSLDKQLVVNDNSKQEPSSSIEKIDNNFTQANVQLAYMSAINSLKNLNDDAKKEVLAEMLEHLKFKLQTNFAEDKLAIKAHVDEINEIILNINYELMSVPQTIAVAVLGFLGAVIGGFAGLFVGALIHPLAAIIGVGAGAIAGYHYSHKLACCGIFKYNASKPKFAELNTFIAASKNIAVKNEMQADQNCALSISCAKKLNLLQ